jgi:chromosome segregation ATPase
VKKYLLLFFVAAVVATFVILVDKYFLPSNKSTLEEQIKVIDQKLSQLHNEIEQLRIEKMNAQTEAQELLPVEWDAYSKKIEEVEKKDIAIESLEKEIKEFNVKKNALESQNPIKKNSY